MYIFREENMLSKLFHISQKREDKKEESCDWDVSLDEFQAQLRLPRLDDSQIRLLIFRDCDRRGKSLLFDSNAAVPVENQSTDKSPCLVRGSALTTKTAPERSPSPKKYQYLKPSSDTNVLGEMVFGSVAMSYKGSTIKIHLIRSPVPTLLISKVFALKSRTPSSAVSESDLTSSSQSESLTNSTRDSRDENLALSTNNSCGDISGSLSSNPMPTPSSLHETALNTSLFGGSLSSIDSFNMSASMNSLYTPSQSPGGSFHRRWFRSQATSLGYSNLYSRKLENGDENFASQRKQPKIGISIMLRLWGDNDEKCRAFQNFFFAHYTLFEAHLQKIRIAIEKAFYLKKNFISVCIETTQRFKTEIYRLYSSPRIVEPVWLNVMGTENHHSDVVRRFTSCLLKVADVCEKKETNHFLSSVLTAVLTHHLAWVPTVTPSGSLPIRSYVDKHSSRTVDMLAKCHPYNPLWAQLGDLYGTIGFPLKISKTIIVGKHRSLVCQLLYILSYFIRCSDVTEHILQADTNADMWTLSTDQSSTTSQTSCASSLRSWMGNAPTTNRTNRVTDRNRTPTNSPSCIANGKLGDVDCAFRCEVNKNTDLVDRKNLENLNTPRNGRLSKESDNGEIDNLGLAVLNIQKGNKDIYENGLFKCYCCSSEGDEKDNIKVLSHNDVDDPSCGCQNSNTVRCKLKRNGIISLLDVEKRDSGGEYDGGTSNDTDASACISRTSSFVSCSDLIKEPHSPDLDSDYCSIANEDLVVSQDSTDMYRNLICRQVSEDPSSEDDFLDMDFLELPLLWSREKKIKDRNQSFKPEHCNLGRSLLAGFCENQISDFVLQGVERYDHEKMVKDLQFSVTHSVLDEPVSDAACIVADTDNWTCKVWNLQRKKDPVMQTISESLEDKLVFASEMVSEMIDTVRHLNEVALPYQICLMHIEDALKDVYTQSKVVAEFARSLGKTVSRAFLEEKFRYHQSDIDLLVAAASTHSPYVSQLIE